MKGIYVIAVAFLASWSVCTASKVQEVREYVHHLTPQDNLLKQCPYPDVNPNNTTSHIAHESDCTKFYKCLLGRGTEQQCPLMWPNDKKKRLHFNRADQTCDWPWNAGCELCPPKGSNGKYPPESKIEDPDSTNCRKYIVCKANGKQTKGTCKSGTCFSRTCQDCVEDREDGKCDDDDDSSSTDPITTTTTTTEGPDPPSCEEDDQKPHDCDCAKFYRCSDDGDWELEECEGGLHFSPKKLKCMSADTAKCKLKKYLPGEITREVYSQE